jgi:proteasome lid subunit RPN8/RPN11
VSLAFSAALDQEIRAEGARAFPHECCGFLLGRLDGERKLVRRLAPADNERESEARRNRFLITPEAYRAADRIARESGLDILGFYHSHPNAPALPSAYDLDHAWPWYSYVIVSVGGEGARQMTSWVLREDRSRFSAEPLEIAAKAEDADRSSMTGGPSWP